MKPKKPNPVPHKLSDHDERSEPMAVEKHWDEESRGGDEAMEAEKNLKRFAADGVPLTDEDWEKEEGLEDKVTDHIDAAVDAAEKHASLEELAEEEMAEDEEE